MKKILSLALAMMMLIASMSAAFAAPGDVGELTELPLTLTSVVDSSASEWMASSETRAMLTVLMCLDMVLALEDDSPITPSLTGTSYVGYGDGYLVVACETQTPGMGVIMLYFADSQSAYYMTAEYGEYSFSSVFEIVLDELCPTGYYANSQDDVLAVAAEIYAMLGE